MSNAPLIWVLTDDRAGNVAQALGVAESLGRPFTVKEIRYTPLARLPNVLMGASVLGVAPENRCGLQAPWPDLVIAAGRRTAPIARWIKRKAGPKSVRLVQLMNPGSGAEDFDLIAVPRHDTHQTPSARVLAITGAPHRLTEAKLKAAGEIWAPRFAALPKPRIALLVGGATHQRPFPESIARTLGEQVQAMASAAGASVLLATSRRTGPAAEAALVAAIPGPRHAFLWSQRGINAGDNPYLGYLALADAIVVTGDSVSMCTEACATRAPVYIYAPEGMVAPKHARLHQELYGLGLARAFEGSFNAWDHPPLNPAGEVARAIDGLLRHQAA